MTQTQQFKRWFGDWQNHLNTASKVVIEDGAPKVVSRGKEKQRRHRHLLRKKEATNLIGAGVHFPVRLQDMIASNPIICSFDAKVNREISDVTQSQQFTRWLGDWQNCPGRASKVVNADGTPKVVYHGTNADFNVFTSKDGICWFSESEDYADDPSNPDIRYSRAGEFYESLMEQLIQPPADSRAYIA